MATLTIGVLGLSMQGVQTYHSIPAASPQIALKPAVADHVVVGSVVITPEPAIASLTVGSPTVVIGHSRPVDCANPLSCGPQLPIIPEDMMTSPTMASSISVLSS